MQVKDLCEDALNETHLQMLTSGQSWVNLKKWPHLRSYGMAESMLVNGFAKLFGRMQKIVKIASRTLCYKSFEHFQYAD